MVVLEHDAKELLALWGLRVPPGALVELKEVREGLCWERGLPLGPWVVKAQVPVGGRGKAGGIRFASTLDQVRYQLMGLLGSTLRGHLVRACRVEQVVSGGEQAYVGFTVDPVEGGVRVLVSRRGGVDIEELDARTGVVRSALAPPEAAALQQKVMELVDTLDPVRQTALRQAAVALAKVFLAYEAVLLEVNPVFLLSNQAWVAGDVKLITDDNALYRHRELQELLVRRAEMYPGSYTKWREGFDYIELNPEGEVALLTTGAGLSMILIDELGRLGLRAYNFCDVGTGQLRGDPQRLVQVLRRVARGSRVKVLLVNVFAGVTHLGEFARLMLEALAQVPECCVPVVARLVGTGLEDAEQILSNAGHRIRLTTELPEAIRIAAALVSGRGVA